MDLHTKNPNPHGLIESEDIFWGNFQHQCNKLHRKYPFLESERKYSDSGVPGEWTFFGAPHYAIMEFKILICGAARRIGYHGTFEMSVQYFMDEMQGDHILRSPKKQVENDREATYTDKDGSKKMYIGRQEHAGFVTKLVGGGQVKDQPRIVTVVPNAESRTEFKTKKA